MIMKEELKKILEQAYELEGLILLGLNREDGPADIARLISSKAEALSRAAATLKVEEQEYNEEPESEETPELVEELESEEAPELVEELESEESLELSEDPEPGEEAETSDFFYNLEDEDTEKPGEVKRPQRPERKKEAPKFSINDKFLFIRELFKGNAASFYDAMDRLSHFSNGAEAEDYFIERLHLDPDNPTAARFLNAIRNYY